ncbi:MAG: YitT family protein [Clostridia bacterium]|nr:YitT family protein [Clostridia bacterium]
MERKISVKKEATCLFFALISSVISGVGLYFFVEPFDFAPSGIDGISAMLRQLTGERINVGIFNFAINTPLLIAALFILKKRYVIYTAIYMLVSTGLVNILHICRVPVFEIENVLIPAIFAGVTQGGTAFMLKIGASAGGVDIIGCMIQTKMRHMKVERIIAVLSYLTIALAFFVFGSLESVLLSAVEVFVCEQVSASVLRSTRSAVRFEIVTDDPKAVCEEIITNLKHGATILKGKGVYSDADKSVIVAVVNYYQVAEFLNIISKQKNTFAYYVDVMGVKGNFDWVKPVDDGGKKRIAEGSNGEKRITGENI